MGTKIMDANIFILNDSLVGRTVIFSGATLSNTLVNPYTAVAFIRDFAPDYSSFVQATAPLVGGARFNVTLTISSAPGHHVEYGFETNGPNARLAGAALLGSAQVVPVPSALLLQLLGDVAGVGPGSSLPDKVTLAEVYYAVPDIQANCGVLTGFVQEVHAQRGKKIAPTKADQLSSEAQAVQVLIGCT